MAVLKAILEGFVSKLVADEAKAMLPMLSQWLVRNAVSRLPKDQRERYSEEWTADLLSYSGEIVRVFRAMGFVCAAIQTSQLSIGHFVQLAVVEVTIMKAILVVRIQRAPIQFERLTSGLIRSRYSLEQRPWLKDREIDNHLIVALKLMRKVRHIAIMNLFGSNVHN